VASRRETDDGGRAVIPRTSGALVLAVALTGCASGPKYACAVPEGVSCQPVSTVYAASSTSTPAHAHVRAPGESVAHDAVTQDASEPDAVAQAANVPGAVVATVQPGEPILTAPRVLRVWIARWEDAGGDLHDETYLYLRIDDGRWTLTR